MSLKYTSAIVNFSWRIASNLCADQVVLPFNFITTGDDLFSALVVEQIFYSWNCNFDVSYAFDV